MNTSSMDTRHLKVLIEDNIQHTYLEKYIQKPVIDEEKLLILVSIINNTTLSTFQKERYIVTTMLVQIALDTHDLVPNKNDLEESNDVKLSKQLKVLAGDYFSGLYYFLLSEIDDFGLIHNLASAIKEINEFKMKLYYKEVNSFQEYISILKKIESLLILHVAQYVNDSTLNYIIGDWLITSKLITEKRKINNEGFSNMLDNCLHYFTDSSYSSMLNTVDAILKDNTKRIDQFLLKLPNHHTLFKAHVKSLLAEQMYTKTSIAEEG